MDWQDVFSFILFFLLVVFSKKRKQEEEDVSPLEEELSPSNVDTVRKRIEALKRKRNAKPQEEVILHNPSTKERPRFSAYKHLPEEQIIETILTPEAIPMVSAEEKPKDILKSIDLSQKKSRLHHWVVGQIVLGTPAYRRYGNFIHR